MMDDKNGFLIYFDLLGYKNIIAQKDEKTINSLKDFIDRQFKVNNVRNIVGLIKGDNFDINNLIFRCYSDNFLIFYKSECDVESLISTVCLASFFSNCSIRNGFMIRGSIVYGTLSYNDNLVFGKSIIEAYELESAHNEPNFVLSKELKKMYEDNKLYENDALSPFLLYDKQDYSIGKECFDGIKKMVERLNLQSFVDERTISKYRWLIGEYNRYYNNYCKLIFEEQPGHYELFYDDTSMNI